MYISKVLNRKILDSTITNKEIPKRTFRRELRSNEYTAFSKTNIHHNYHEELFVELFAHNIKRYEKGHRKNSSTAYVLSDVYPNTNYAVECLLKNKRPNKFKSLK